MLNKDEIFDDDIKKVELICPECHSKKLVKIPKKLVTESNSIITISIPSNFICEHGFQAFLDRQFAIRGYQNADFEITEMELYETGTRVIDEIINYEMSKIIKKGILALKASKEIESIIGGALFNEKGQILYNSLPDEVFISLINQFEIKKLGTHIKFKEIIIHLEDNTKLVAKLYQTSGHNLILVVLFSSKYSLMDIMNYLNELSDNFLIVEGSPQKLVTENLRISNGKEQEGIRYSNYWIYSKITSDIPFSETSSFYFETLGVKIDKTNILNLEEIIKESKNNQYEGKLYFSEKYVKLMEGLAYTIKDAANFISKLNIEK